MATKSFNICDYSRDKPPAKSLGGLYTLCPMVPTLQVHESYSAKRRPLK